ncbi:MAG TPA: efflux RND transporter periplasmic adaptor subunit [Kofleriaceae bacterium]|nr:efflux RND transporter periplasmic adaptor subunit [Kofleriaceae bacterium]
MRTFLFVAVAVLGLACKKGGDASQAAKPSAPPIKVQTAVAVEAPVPDVLVLTGTVAADQRSDVTADTQGKVLNVMIQRGDRVKLGQAVIQLDVRNAALSAREAQANLAAARAQKELAEQECARTKQLLDKGAITKDEYDRQMEQCTSSLEQVAAAQARTDMMMKSVTDGMVRAPFDGVVSEKMVSPGEWVQPGKALFTLVDDDPLKVELSVPEAAVLAVKKDEPVTVKAVAAPDKYQAKVTRLGGEIGKQRSLIVEATLDKGSPLVPGMFVEATLVKGQITLPVIPASAVTDKRGKGLRVYVVVKGELEERIVQVGEPPAPDRVAIVKGVAKGDKVVTDITDAVVDGAKVVE